MPLLIQQDPGIARRRKLAESMLARGKTGPVRTGMEGAGRLAQTMANVYGVYKADKDQKEYMKAGNEDLARIISDYGNDVRPLSQHASTAGPAAQVQMMQMQQDRASEAAAAARAQSLGDAETARINKLSDAKEMSEHTARMKQKYHVKGSPLVQVGGNVSKGDEKADEKFADEYQKWITGGYADVEKSVAQLEEVSASLGDPQKNLTGGDVGMTPDFILQRTNPEAVATREAIEEIVQRNLRLILGAQFTEKEGDRLIKRAYNPNLSEAENKKRVDRLLKQIKSAAISKQAAVDYFAEKGTLKGFKGKTYTKADFEDAIDGTSASGKSTNEDLVSKYAD